MDKYPYFLDKPEIRYYKGVIRCVLFAKQPYLRSGVVRFDDGTITVAPLRLLWKKPKK